MPYDDDEDERDDARDDEDDDLDEFDVRRRPDDEPTADDKQMAMFAHLGGIFAGFLVPLIIWQIKKDQSRFVDDQAREALNFQLTGLIYSLGGVAVTIVTCGFGFPLVLAVAVVDIIYSCIAASAANRGERYRYPGFTIRFIK